MFIILSDLHFGCGDALEDFLDWGTTLAGPSVAERAVAASRLDQALARLLAS
ncbi:hypothetical protein HZA57_08065, partial [Candidatus Poribacteria bacterium]|nr:hypothetical protein [Candidatus Poribacteria bacterium]